MNGAYAVLLNEVLYWGLLINGLNARGVLHSVMAWRISGESPYSTLAPDASGIEHFILTDYLGDV